MSGIKHLADFLQKFKAIRDPSLDKKIISFLLKKHCGVDVDSSCVQIKKHVISLSAHPAVKSAIYMKKTQLLKSINEELPERFFADIN